MVQNEFERYSYPHNFLLPAVVLQVEDNKIYQIFRRINGDLNDFYSQSQERSIAPVTKFTYLDLETFLKSTCGAMDFLVENGFLHGDHGAGENTFFEHHRNGTSFWLADFQLSRQYKSVKELNENLPGEKSNFNKMLMLYVFTMGYVGGGSFSAMDSAYGPELRNILIDFGYKERNKSSQYTFSSLQEELLAYPY